MKRLLIVPALAVLLSGCGIAAKVNARHDRRRRRSPIRSALLSTGRTWRHATGGTGRTKLTFRPIKLPQQRPDRDQSTATKSPRSLKISGRGLLANKYTAAMNASAPLLWGYVTALFYLRALITRLAMVKC
jgi:hypothetical protein